MENLFEPDIYNRYPKAKYELWMDCWLYYFFVTTCRSPEECLSIMIDKGKTSHAQGSTRFKIYETVNGERKLIYHEGQSILPATNMEVRTEEISYKRAAW